MVFKPCAEDSAQPRAVQWEGFWTGLYWRDNAQLHLLCFGKFGGDGQSRDFGQHTLEEGFRGTWCWVQMCPPFPDAEQSMDDLGLDFRLVSDRSFGAQITPWCILKPSSMFVPADSCDLSILWRGLQAQSKLFVL